MSKIIFIFSIFFFQSNAWSSLDQAELAAKMHRQDEISIRASQIALHKAQDKEVVAYAKRVIAHHMAASKVLLSLVKAEAFKLQSLANFDEGLSDLEFVSGEQFEEAYIQLMVDLHQWTLLSLDEAFASDAQKTPVRALGELLQDQLRANGEAARRLLAKRL